MTVDPSSAAGPERSVIVCAFADERLPLLLEAIASLQRQTVDAELVIVIDGNPGLQAEVARRSSGVRVIAHGGPRGLSGARNAGVAAARGRRLAFLDDDAVAEPDWLERLDACFADPRVMVSGGTILAAWAESRPRWFPEEFDWVVGCTYRGQVGFDAGARASGAPVAIRNVIGASMMMRREALDAVGGFSTALGRVGSIPVGDEETELCIRVAQRFGHGSVVAAPAAVVHHHVPVTRGTWSYFRRRCHAEGLSKAVLVGLSGSRDGLSSEVRYLTRTLPLAVLRHLGTAVRGDPGGLGRAAAVIGGVASTGVGWLRGNASRAWRRGATRGTAGARP